MLDSPFQWRLAGSQGQLASVMTTTTTRAHWRQVLGVIVVDKFLDMCQLVMEVLKVLLIFLVLATGDGRSVLLNDLSLQALQRIRWSTLGSRDWLADWPGYFSNLNATLTGRVQLIMTILTWCHTHGLWYHPKNLKAELLLYPWFNSLAQLH